jgi:5-hydroxyisourate hydrolase
MAKLTLNFFDTTRGVAIPNIDVEVQKIRDGNWQTLAELNSDIHGDVTISDSEGDLSGYYEAIARIGNYFLDAGYALPTLKFVDVLPIRFGIAEAEADTTITISLTPYGYSFQAK